MFNKMFNKKNLIITTSISWSLLGFTRGINNYDSDYNYEKSNMVSKKNSSYLYSTKIMYGLLGSFIYMNPIFIIITIPKEIYRFEVNLRNLEDEKKSIYYKNLI